MRVRNSSNIFDDESLREMTRCGWNVNGENSVFDIQCEPSDKLYEGYCGPSRDVVPHAVNSASLFYYFLPKSFWRTVAKESNLYWEQSFDNRVEAAWKRHSKLNPGANKSVCVPKIISKLKKFKKITPHELVLWIGLLVARVLNPRKFLHMHWSTEKDGLIPPGTFSEIMSRSRFQQISEFLHFSNNLDERSKKDRAWKIRPILQTIEQTFKQGYALGSRIALDEGMLPSRSRMNPTRTYMKDKPHKWGSKCVMTCCAVSGYCKRCVSYLLYPLPKVKIMLFRSILTTTSTGLK
jgi:hypothetical protein